MNEQHVDTTVYSLKPEFPQKGFRQRPERHLSLFRVGALTVAGRRELCLIRNVSAGGMLIRAYSGIATGTKLSIELKQGEPVKGIARWSENDLVGVEFDEPVDVVSLITTSADGPRPRMPRIEVDCLTTIRDGAKIYRTRATNASQGGVRVRSSDALPVGTNVVVTVNGLAPAAGVVKWKDGDYYGIGFDRVLSVSKLVEWLQTQQERLREAS